MLSKHWKRINSPSISAKVEKAACRKGQMKLFLLKWLKLDSHDIDPRIKMFKRENLEKYSIQLNSAQ